MTGHIKFSVDAGILAPKGELKSLVRGKCRTLDLTCDIDEDKGFLSSTLHFYIIGKDSDLTTFYDWIKVQDWFKLNLGYKVKI